MELIQIKFNTSELKLIQTGLEALKRIVTSPELNELRQKVESSLRASECNCGGSKIDPEHIEAQPCKCQKESLHITDPKIREALEKSLSPQKYEGICWKCDYCIFNEYKISYNCTHPKAPINNILEDIEFQIAEFCPIGDSK